MAQKNHGAFLMSVVTEYDRRRIRAVPGFDTPGGFLAPYYAPREADSHLTDFEVTAYLEPGRGQAWGTSHQFTPHRVDLWRAEVMLQVLRKVDQGMQKAQQQFGYPDTFHAYLLQVAYALGIKRFLVGSDDGEPFANGARYLTHNAVSVASWITQQENTYCQPVQV
jgi:hypothetical protein